MLEHVESKHAIKDGIGERQVMCITHHVGVAENASFELDEIRVTLARPACAYIQHKIATFFENAVKRCADRVAGVLDELPRHLIDENRHAVLEAIISSAAQTLDFG